MKILLSIILTSLLYVKNQNNFFQKKMREKIANLLKIDVNLINIKGTTTEKLGFLGREEGIACQTIVTVSKKNDFFLE